MKRWIPAALAAAALLPGCKSDREIITGNPETPKKALDIEPPKPPGPSTGPGPTKVDDSKFRTTQSGLKIAIIRPGSGPEVKTHQEAIVHYTGWLKDGGTKFDSSRDRGEPYPVVIDESQVIQGWHEGLKGMKVGEQRQIIIPPHLGYRSEGNPPKIPPDATLVFDLELMGIGEHSH